MTIRKELAQNEANECQGGCKYSDIRLIESNITEKSVKFTYKCEKCGKIHK
jgi:hypothetical protein